MHFLLLHVRVEHGPSRHGRIAGPKREKVQESAENCVLRRVVICISRKYYWG
jgi:hypothetical protein